jgi:hypothetical protein
VLADDEFPEPLGSLMSPEKKRALVDCWRAMWCR